MLPQEASAFCYKDILIADDDSDIRNLLWMTYQVSKGNLYERIVKSHVSWLENRCESMSLTD